VAFAGFEEIAGQYSRTVRKRSTAGSRHVQLHREHTMAPKKIKDLSSTKKSGSVKGGQTNKKRT
jgi:hypothetical protein